MLEFVRAHPLRTIRAKDGAPSWSELVDGKIGFDSVGNMLETASTFPYCETLA